LMLVLQPFYLPHQSLIESRNFPQALISLPPFKPSTRNPEFCPKGANKYNQVWELSLVGLFTWNGPDQKSLLKSRSRPPIITYAIISEIPFIGKKKIQPHCLANFQASTSPG
jgi:hypothetical protein